MTRQHKNALEDAPMVAAIYARKSTDQPGVADEHTSVTRQIDHARAYATSKGWAVADEQIYSDNGISGAEFAKRPRPRRRRAGHTSDQRGRGRRGAGHLHVVQPRARHGTHRRPTDVQAPW